MPENTPRFVAPRTWHAATYLAVFTTFFFHKILFGSAFLWEDFLEQEIPYRAFAANCLQHGTFPLWNPYTFCGMPFFAELQTAVLYPTNLLLTWLISAGSLGTWWIEFFIIGHFWIAAFGMFLLCRREFFQGWYAALFAALAYGFSGMMVTHAIHQGMIFQFAWLPWVVLCMLRGTRVRDVRWFIGGGMLLGLSLLAGHPQITLYTFTALGIIAVAMLVNEWKSGKNTRRTASLAVSYGAMIAIAVGIFAVQYLPSVELADRVVRSDVTYEFASEGSLQYSQLLTALVPKFFGSSEAVPTKLPFWLYQGHNYFLFWETCFYCGIATLLLAYVGWYRGKKMPLRGALIALAAFALLYALGDNFVLFPALFQLPLFNKFRDPARIMYLFTFAAAIFAGRGVDMLSEQRAKLFPGSKTVWIWLGSGIAFGLLLLTIGGSMLDVPDQLASWVHADVWLFIVAWSASVLIIWRLEQTANVQTALFLVLVLGADLFFFGGGINDGVKDPKLSYNAHPEILAKLRTESAGELFRVKMRDGGNMLMQRNQGPVDKLFLIEGYSPLVLQRHIPVMFSPQDQADMMNVKYEVAVDTARRSMYMRSRSDYMPRAFVVYQAIVLDDSGVIRALLEPFDIHTSVLLEQPSIALPETNAHPVSTVRITSYDVNEIHLTAETSENGILVTGEIDYPGWTVTIDNEPATLLRANSCLRAVALPKGKHEVVFSFAPAPVKSGMWISLSVLVACVVGFAGVSVGRKRFRKTSA